MPPDPKAIPTSNNGTAIIRPTNVNRFKNGGIRRVSMPLDQGSDLDKVGDYLNFFVNFYNLKVAPELVDMYQTTTYGTYIQCIKGDDNNWVFTCGGNKTPTQHILIQPFHTVVGIDNISQGKRLLYLHYMIQMLCQFVGDTIIMLVNKKIPSINHALWIQGKLQAAGRSVLNIRTEYNNKTTTRCTDLVNKQMGILQVFSPLSNLIDRSYVKSVHLGNVPDDMAEVVAGAYTMFVIHAVQQTTPIFDFADKLNNYISDIYVDAPTPAAHAPAQRELHIPGVLVTKPVVSPVPKPVVSPVPKPVVSLVPKPVVSPVPKPVVSPVIAALRILMGPHLLEAEKEYTDASAAVATAKSNLAKDKTAGNTENVDTAMKRQKAMKAQRDQSFRPIAQKLANALKSATDEVTRLNVLKTTAEKELTAARNNASTTSTTLSTTRQEYKDAEVKNMPATTEEENILKILDGKVKAAEASDLNANKNMKKTSSNVDRYKLELKEAEGFKHLAEVGMTMLINKDKLKSKKPLKKP